jgi:hypothetical protein
MKKDIPLSSFLGSQIEGVSIVIPILFPILFPLKKRKKIEKKRPVIIAE